MTKPYRSERSKSARHSSSVNTRPDGFAGEHTYSNCVRCPLLLAQRVQIEREAVGFRLIEKERLGAGQQAPRLHRSGRRDSDRRPPAVRSRRIDDGLTERKQRLAGAVDRQHLRARIERLQSVAPLEPRGDGFAQTIETRGRRIHREPVQVLAVSARRITSGVACCGSPIDRGIGVPAGFSPASSARSFSKG